MNLEGKQAQTYEVLWRDVHEPGDIVFGELCDRDLVEVKLVSTRQLGSPTRNTE